MYQGFVEESVLILLWLYEPAIIEKFVIRDLFQKNKSALQMKQSVILRGEYKE